MTGLIGSEDVVALYDGHARALHRYLARRVGAETADDLVAEAFLLVWQQRGEYDPELASLKTWLYGIATNLLLRHTRAEVRRLRAWSREHGRREPAEAVEDRATARADAGALSADLARTVAGLRHEERDVLLLVAWAGLTPTEVAEALSVPVVTVRTRLHRARAKVRDRLPLPSRWSGSGAEENGDA
ncbi:RNA polymerase sigma-70 factor (ECF subfamily) [Crossiella equi]|uniref:RNA polymerase sigma-70 factor (ECF subfamily) n=1 Tax=Crossiella equi TaxID=130796 RepID=A0ABS5AQT2_9PSEU|nr:sigma-70 family RNA polymerase sigma factor [Crossiella equi]MBP2478923.1 RNA polymerase sigma-70 factor (ECF subfamily) [Crossiella equi]